MIKDLKEKKSLTSPHSYSEHRQLPGFESSTHLRDRGWARGKEGPLGPRPITLGSHLWVMTPVPAGVDVPVPSLSWAVEHADGVGPESKRRASDGLPAAPAPAATGTIGQLAPGPWRPNFHPATQPGGPRTRQAGPSGGGGAGGGGAQCQRPRVGWGLNGRGKQKAAKKWNQGSARAPAAHVVL